MERRIRTFPMTFEITKPTRFDPGGMKMYYAHEWEAHLKESQPAQSTDEPAQANEAPAQPAAAHGEAPPSPWTQPLLVPPNPLPPLSPLVPLPPQLA